MAVFGPAVICSLLLAAAASASNILAQFPNTGINAVQIDSAGNIYAAGFQGTVGVSNTYDAFVSKLSPDGSQVLYTTTFAGSKSDIAVALAIDSAGAAYILGETQSPDFPVTAGALQTTLLAPNTQGFVAKVGPNGNVVYATFFGGSSDIIPSAGGLLVDPAGDVFASGESTGGTFPTTAGVPFTDTGAGAYFLLKLDPTGSTLLASMRGMGGLIASDASGSVYIAGVQLSDPTMIPVTPGAYQSSYQLNSCSGDDQLAFPCLYQYVAKLDSNLSQIFYATYLTGSYGAFPSAISVDAEGDVWLAGTTNSPDYPVTGQFQPFYLASAPPGPQGFMGTVYPPPASGYITEVTPTGSALFYSTYFSGSVTDTITFAAVTTSGIYFAGQAGSPDLPGLEGVPLACMPESYATVITPDGLTLTATRSVPGNVLAYNPITNMFLSWTGTALVSSDPLAPQTPIACILDVADLLPVSSIAPGELLSIFGANFDNGTSAAGSAPFPPALGDVTVTLNGLSAPLLYVSPQQINLQAPFEIAGSQQAVLNLSTSQTNISDSRTLGVTASNPVAFLDTVTLRVSEDWFHCPLNGAVYGGGPLPLAYNSDGSQNTCSNPAAAGSVVRILLQGLGVTSPPQLTGSVNSNAYVSLNLPVTFNSGNSGSETGTIVDAVALSGAAAGVWAVDLTLPAADLGANPISLSVNSVPVRDGILTIWTH